MSRVQTIKKRLSELRALDKRSEVFGASRHQHKLNPPLTSPQRDRFEAEFSVSLPPDLVAFLLEVGNGGAGPDYGLKSLEESAAALRELERWCQTKGHPFHPLNEPFPFTRADAQRILDSRNQRANQNDFPMLSLPGDKDQNAGGSMLVCEQGCGWEGYVVITGEQRGNFWESEGGYSFSPWGNDPDRTDFLSWYESWLDRWLEHGAIERWTARGNRVRTIGRKP